MPKPKLPIQTILSQHTNAHQDPDLENLRMVVILASDACRRARQSLDLAIQAESEVRRQYKAAKKQAYRETRKKNMKEVKK